MDLMTVPSVASNATPRPFSRNYLSMLHQWEGINHENFLFLFLHLVPYYEKFCMLAIFKGFD